MNAAEQSNPFEDASSLQLSSLEDRKLDQTGIDRINDKKANIWQQVQKAAEFNDAEKSEIKTKLEFELRDDNINEINKFAANIERRRKNISQTINRYFDTLDRNKQFFAKREDYDAIKLYKEEFLALDEEGKQKWLEALQADIHDRIKLHEELSAHVSKDQLSRMRRSELRRMELYIKECDNILSANKDIFSPNEQSSIKAQIADCTSHRDQMKLLTKITGQIDQRKWYAQVYKRLPPKYQQAWGDISKMTFEEKAQGYEKVIINIEEDYESTLANHPDRKHIGAQDRKAALKYVRSDNVSGGDKYRALKNLESQIKKQKTEVSDPFEAALEKLAKSKSPKDIKKLRDQFYDTETYDKRKALTAQILEELMEETGNSAEVKDLTTEYDTHLNADLADRIIGKITHLEARKIWKQKDLKEMQETMEIYETDRARRVKLLKEFLALPEEVQQDNFDFFEMTHTDRATKIAKLHGIKLPKMEKPDIENIKETKSTQNTKTIEKEQITETIKTEKAEDNAEAKLASDKLKMVKKVVEEATNTSTVKKRRKRNQISKHLVEEAVSSEAKHGSSRVQNRTKGLDTRGRKLAEDLYNHSGGNSMLQKGEATKIIWSHYKGFRKLNDDNEEAAIERQVRRDIINDSSKDPFNAIQFYNDSNGVSNANMAKKELEERTQETRDIIKNSAEKKLVNAENPDIALQKAIKKEVAQKNLTIELKAA